MICEPYVFLVLILTLIFYADVLVPSSYFNEDEEPEDELEYQPAPGSPAANEGGGRAAANMATDKGLESDGSDDPLDMFMQDIEVP